MLAEVIPAYEVFMTNLERAKDHFPAYGSIISDALDISTKYYKFMDDTEAYVLCLCEYLNTSLDNDLTLLCSLAPSFPHGPHRQALGEAVQGQSG